MTISSMMFIRRKYFALGSSFLVFCLICVQPFNAKVLSRPRVPDLNQEAQQEARKFIDARILQHSSGDAFSFDPHCSGCTNDGYYQYKEFAYDISTDVVTEIDKLNGIEWKGAITVHAAAYRSLSVDSFHPADGKWSEWGLFKLSDIPLKKKRGTWRIGGVGFGLGKQAPTAAQVDQVINLPMFDNP